MVALSSLWLPILLSAVIVFVASSLIHMFLGYHKTDYTQLPREAEVMDALRKFGIPPGDYMVPRPSGTADMKSPEYLDKVNKGPVAIMTVMPNGMVNMGQTMVLWFVYLLVAPAHADQACAAASERTGHPPHPALGPDHGPKRSAWVRWYKAICAVWPSADGLPAKTAHRPRGHSSANTSRPSPNFGRKRQNGSSKPKASARSVPPPFWPTRPERRALPQKGGRRPRWPGSAQSHSGKFRGQRHISGGRAPLRRALTWRQLERQRS